MAELKKLKAIRAEGLEFKDGFTIRDFHRQDCCESVYADWDYLEEECPIGTMVDVDKFEIVPEAGIRIGGYFVPCYNSQNGYYSSDLQLTFATPDGWKKTIDISEGVEDQIDY